MPGTPFVFPNDRTRTTVIGRTGTGKTQAGVWLLSHASYDRRPWIVFDYKRDELLNAIPFAERMDVTDKVPKHPGIYLVGLHPSESEQAEDLMNRIWEREGVGVFVDEGLMVQRGSDAYQAVLTQGRSKSIPVITLIQRPFNVNRCALSEANYFMVFEISDRQDKKRVEEFTPLDMDRSLPGEFYSWWYDAKRKYTCKLRPVPDASTILDTFYERLRQPRRVI